MQKKGIIKPLSSNPSEVALVNFINTILKLNTLEWNQQKQKYMYSSHRVSHSESSIDIDHLFGQQISQATAEILKEQMNLSEFEFEEYSKGDDYVALMRCLQSITIMMVNFFQQKQNDLNKELQLSDTKYKETLSELAMYHEENGDLKEIIETLENQRKGYDEKLNRSETELQRDKNEIEIQKTERESLHAQIATLLRTVQQLEQENNSLKATISTFEERSITKNEQMHDLTDLNSQLSKQVEQIKEQLEKLREQKEFLQRQMEAKQHLIEEKDFIIQDKIYNTEGEDMPLSASHSYPYFKGASFTVKEENQNDDCYEDKEIMRGIQIEYMHEPITALKFGVSRSISNKSQTSLEKVEFNNADLESPENNHKSNKQQSASKGHTQTNKKFSPRDGSKPLLIKKVSKVQSDKKKQTSAFKTPVAKRQKQTAQHKVSSKSRPGEQKQPNNNQKKDTAKSKVPPLPLEKMNKTTIKMQRQQSCVDLSGGRKREISHHINSNSDNRTVGIHHSQSAENIFLPDDENDLEDKAKLQKELQNRKKQIELLRFQNRSVHRMALEQADRLTETEGQHEMMRQRQEEKLEYYRKESKAVFAKYIDEKSRREAIEIEYSSLIDEFQEQREKYQEQAALLKVKCKNHMDEQISIYREKYEEIKGKMERIIVQGNTQENPSSARTSELKKCNSSSLFYNQVGHHSYKTSQQYSEIQGPNYSQESSVNHSKNASLVLKVDHDNSSEFALGDRSLNNSFKNSRIVIKDYEHNAEEDVVEEESFELHSYREEREFNDQETQTQFYEEDSVLKIVDSFEISYELSSQATKSLQAKSTALLPGNHRLSIQRQCLDVLYEGKVSIEPSEPNNQQHPENSQEIEDQPTNEHNHNAKMHDSSLTTEDLTEAQSEISHFTLTNYLQSMEIQTFSIQIGSASIKCSAETQTEYKVGKTVLDSMVQTNNATKEVQETGSQTNEMMVSKSQTQPQKLTLSKTPKVSIENLFVSQQTMTEQQFSIQSRVITESNTPKRIQTADQSLQCQEPNVQMKNQQVHVQMQKSTPNLQAFTQQQIFGLQIGSTKSLQTNNGSSRCSMVKQVDFSASFATKKSENSIAVQFSPIETCTHSSEQQTDDANSQSQQLPTKEYQDQGVNSQISIFHEQEQQTGRKQFCITNSVIMHLQKPIKNAAALDFFNTVELMFEAPQLQKSDQILHDDQKVSDSSFMMKEHLNSFVEDLTNNVSENNQTVINEEFIEELKEKLEKLNQLLMIIEQKHDDPNRSSLDLRVILNQKDAEDPLQSRKQSNIFHGIKLGEVQPLLEEDKNENKDKIFDNFKQMQENEVTEAKGPTLSVKIEEFSQNKTLNVKKSKHSTNYSTPVISPENNQQESERQDQRYNFIPQFREISQEQSIYSISQGRTTERKVEESIQRQSSSKQKNCQQKQQIKSIFTDQNQIFSPRVGNNNTKSTHSFNFSPRNIIQNFAFQKRTNLSKISFIRKGEEVPEKETLFSHLTFDEKNYFCSKTPSKLEIVRTWQQIQDMKEKGINLSKIYKNETLLIKSKRAEKQLYFSCSVLKVSCLTKRFRLKSKLMKSFVGHQIQECLVLGNQEVILNHKSLKIALSNKQNYYSVKYPQLAKKIGKFTLSQKHLTEKIQSQCDGTYLVQKIEVYRHQ